MTAPRATDAHVRMIFACADRQGIAPEIMADIRRRIRARTLTKADASAIIDVLVSA